MCVRVRVRVCVCLCVCAYVYTMNYYLTLIHQTLQILVICP